MNLTMRMVLCKKYNESLEGLDRAPYPGEFGQKIFESISKKAWTDWMEHQKKIINELKLTVFKPEAQEILKKHAEEFFFGTPQDPKNLH